MSQVWMWVGFQHLGVDREAVSVDNIFIAYTSNIFAILGLRALYFLLAGVNHRFHYLKLGLRRRAGVHGRQDALGGRIPSPVGSSLGVIALVLTASVLASLSFPTRVEAGDPVIRDPLERKPPDPVPSPPLENTRTEDALP